MQACAEASLELTARSKGLRYIPRSEILTRPQCPQATKDDINPMAVRIAAMGQKALIPDDLFGLEYPGVGFRFFAVEIDRNTESIEPKSVAQDTFDANGAKIAGYLEILRHQTYRTRYPTTHEHNRPVSVLAD